MAELTANITGAAFRPFNCSFPLYSFHLWCHLTTGCSLILAPLKWMLLHFCGSAFSLRYTLSHGEGLHASALHSDMERGRWLEEWLSSPYMAKVLRGSMADVNLKSELRYWEQKWRQEFSLLSPCTVLLRYKLKTNFHFPESPLFPGTHTASAIFSLNTTGMNSEATMLQFKSTWYLTS